MSKSVNETIVKLHTELLNGTVELDDLEKYKPEFSTFLSSIDEGSPKKIDTNVLRSFLLLCMDYYYYSSKGDVLIPDSDFDRAMTTYCSLTKNGQIVYPDYSPQTKGTTWELKKHNASHMVGSVDKFYVYEDLIEWLESYSDRLTSRNAVVIVAPKYDGVGVSIEYKKGQPIFALTRKDRVYGQDISRCIELASNIDEVIQSGKFYTKSDHFFIKGEILVSQSHFNKLKEITSYKNRRSATTGITNTPQNIKYAPWLDVIPLCYYNADAAPGKCPIHYEPGITQSHELSILLYEDAISHHGKNLISAIRKKLLRLAEPDFDYRYDGVVVFIQSSLLDYDEDVMKHARAYKINTKKGVTKIKDAYVSVGRTGKATPMINVYPCDVNETEVTDVSLSNFTKARKYNLHKNDTIEIISAGDVIPQLNKILEQGSVEPLKWDMHCPHCGSAFSSYKNRSGEYEYMCDNPNCIRVVSGNIANFLEKMGAENMSDVTIADLCERLKSIRSISDIFNVKETDLTQLSGWGDTSASDFVNELNRIRNTPIPYSTFLGALGIPSVSKKKCRKILTGISYKELMELVNSKPIKVEEKIMAMDGIGPSTAEVFIDFLTSNYTVIRDLESLFYLIPDNPKVYNVVFTQFRDRDYIKQIEELGYEISENVNKETVAVVSTDMNAKKIKKARERGIPTYHASDLSKLLEDLEAMRLS